MRNSTIFKIRPKRDEIMGGDDRKASAVETEESDRDSTTPESDPTEC